MDGQYYDPTNPKYKCCCGCHVTTGTKIICWINIILVALIVISNIYYYPQPEMIGGSIVLLIITAIVAVAPLYGLRVENHKWLIPFLIASVSSFY
uniref:Uncharacterized protein n=1 Tax=Panagrolaimus davidi TaxID=227884 RepID=A0A914QXZ1_9BILA